ncbi:MAG TPA: hypothetical protein VFN68_14250 [Acidimicrobiales bacterium]|nr:hypothetical protein [Acidimicrobiales bacterium]
MSRFVGRGAVVVAIWAGLNGVLAALLFVFSARASVQERAFYWGAVAILVLTSGALLVVPRTRPVSPPSAPGGQARNGAPAAAFAAACLVGGLAWVFGVFIAYFALPLIAFCLARWRVEWAERRKETRS